MTSVQACNGAAWGWAQSSVWLSLATFHLDHLSSAALYGRWLIRLPEAPGGNVHPRLHWRQWLRKKKCSRTNYFVFVCIISFHTGSHRNFPTWVRELTAFFPGGLLPVYGRRISSHDYFSLCSAWHRRPWALRSQKKKDDKDRSKAVQEQPAMGSHNVTQTWPGFPLPNTAAPDHAGALSTQNVHVQLRCAKSKLHTGLWRVNTKKM